MDIEHHNQRCGFISVIGETNVGKSTMVNALVGEKVSIVSRKVQTTVFRILGIAISGDSQIILIDTPGFYKKHSAPNLEKTAWDAFRESDLVLFVIDAAKRNLSVSEELLKKIDVKKKVILILNKVDLIHKPKLLSLVNKLSKIRNFESVFMISSINGDGIEDLKTYLSQLIPVGEWLFDKDSITDMSLEQYVAEITREHVYHRIHQEVPYECSIETQSIQKIKNGEIRIYQTVFVSSKAHIGILVGKKGEKIKAIGSAAREELSELLDTKIHLFLDVKIKK